MPHRRYEHDSEFLYTNRRADGIYGLYARVMLFEGERIIDVASGDEQPERTFRTIEVDAGHFLHPEGMFTNHSCDPSAAVDGARGVMFAVRDIQIGEEITFDYLESESELVSSFNCSCGAENCVGAVGENK